MTLAATLAALATSRPARADGACGADKDCSGDLICVEHACVTPGAAGAPAAAPDTAAPAPAAPATASTPASTSCTSDAGGECTEGLPPLPSGHDFFLGATYVLPIGVAGDTQNAVPEHAVGLEIANGARIRYHLIAAYESLNGWTGALVEPLTFGYAVRMPIRAMNLEVEPIVSAGGFEMLFNDAHALSMTAGARVQGVLTFGSMFVAVTPIGIDYRYLSLVGDGHQDNLVPGTGINWRLGSTVGLRL